MTTIPEAAVTAAATAMLTPQMRRILHAAGLEYELGQDALMAQQARLGLEAAAPLIAPPDGAVEAAVLAERAAMRGAVGDERRECANLAELTGIPYGPWRDSAAPDTFDAGAAEARNYIAKAIRARSASPKPGSGE